jgi:hypothetical protein
MSRKTFPLVLILLLALTACSIRIDLPFTQKVGPLVVDPIEVAAPADASQPVDLSLDFGAGSLKLHPGTQSLVSGTASYNVPDFKPTVEVNGSSVAIRQGEWTISGIPDFGNIKNEWDLALGTIPISLDIDAGAYEAEFELGGLNLLNLNVDDGASDVELNFDAPNLGEMALFSYDTGASNVSLLGLGNANFTSLKFSSGAGNYTLDFNGTLRRDGSVHITTGVSNLTLVIPEGVPARVTVQGALNNVTTASGFEVAGDVYTQAGAGSQLTIVVEIGAGNLTLTH